MEKPPDLWAPSHARVCSLQRLVSAPAPGKRPLQDAQPPLFCLSTFSVGQNRTISYKSEPSTLQSEKHRCQKQKCILQMHETQPNKIICITHGRTSVPSVL